jgi:hypothetical protein
MPANRRTFLLAGGGALIAHAVPPADQVVVGVIGSGGRGTLVMTTFQRDAAVRIGAICDVFEPNLEKAISFAGTHPKPYRNYKELADKDIQAVVIATPEHYATDLHVANFLECVRTRKTPTAPMKLAFQAALVVQMANLSLKSGRRMRWNAATSKVES